MSKFHPYIEHMKHGIGISPMLQSHMLEFANDQPFERAMALLETALPAVSVGSSQSQRLTQYFGNLPAAEEILSSPGFDFEREVSDHGEEQVLNNVLYVQVDGGHLRTDEGYRETKVGRIFAAHHLIKKSSDNEGVNRRMELASSDYLAHLGHYAEFTARFDPLIRAHLRQAPNIKMVAISDGAEWIAKWLLAEYPAVIFILDFYHALEHLADFATLVFTSDTNRSDWIECRRKELLAGQIDQVIAAIREKMAGRRQAIIDKAELLIAYYEKNRYRMKYDEYRAAGYCIGSGAIESAISTVVQQRCKLVGQRWTQRVTAVLNIRAIFKSGKRDKLRMMINQQMGYAKAA